MVWFLRTGKAQSPQRCAVCPMTTVVLRFLFPHGLKAFAQGPLSAEDPTR